MSGGPFENMRTGLGSLKTGIVLEGTLQRTSPDQQRAQTKRSLRAYIFENPNSQILPIASKGVSVMRLESSS